ncbi:thiamine phosphate synthase [Bacillota bacterium LX-D]|nr:thiamine phosphate synthase [Bacillota bacterium LX-D]
MPIDYALYLVTDRTILKNRDLPQAVEEAIKGGITMLQLREKEASSADFYRLALKIKALAKANNIPLIINDRLDIALAVDADGLHIGQEDLPLKVARKLLGKDKILGYSVSNVAEAGYGEENGADYLGAGPVYPTNSKAAANNPIGIKCLEEVKKSVSVPVVAIGGIGFSNIKEVKNTKVDGVSLISSILGSDNIEDTTRGLLKLWREE